MNAKQILPHAQAKLSLCALNKMFKPYALFFRIYSWWIIYFAGARLFFLLFHYNQASELKFREWIKIFWYGFQMYLSMGGYFMVLCGLLLALSFSLKKNFLSVIHIVNKTIILLTSLIIVADAELYLHWGFRLTTAPLLYLDSEAAGTLPMLRYIFLLTLWLIFTTVAIILYNRIAGNQKLPESRPLHLWGVLLLTVLLIIPIRGSFQVSTMNISRVYFHPAKPFANHAGINATWSFMYSAWSKNQLKYPEDFFDKNLTESYFKKLYPKQDSTRYVLQNNRPNILLIILEGIDAEVVGPLGGRDDVMPNLNRLCREGIFFDRFYANGDRTDKGLVSILTAYPAQPRGSIIKYAHKTQQLHYLSTDLIELGYEATFVYGGDVDFANYRSLFTNGHFSHITSLDDFPESLESNKWGIHDEFLFNQVLHELDTTRQLPFFKVVLTLSSHEPFDVPMTPVFQGSDEATHYLNACHYADRCLGDFIAKARTKNWWENTLVIITADHGHRLPGNKRPEQKEKYHIPMLWLGGAVAADTVVHTLGNQSDIANTLLAQLQHSDSRFIFSKNLLGKPVTDFAMFVFNDGYGFIAPDAFLVYDNPGHRFIIQEGSISSEYINCSKAYMEKLYLDYNSKR